MGFLKRDPVLNTLFEHVHWKDIAAQDFIVEGANPWRTGAIRESRVGQSCSLKPAPGNAVELFTRIAP
jgi:hypothetical protein